MRKVIVVVCGLGAISTGWAGEVLFEGDVLRPSGGAGVEVRGTLEGDKVTLSIEEDHYEATVTEVMRHPLYASWSAAGPGFTVELTVVPRTGTIPTLELSQCEDAWIAITTEVPLQHSTTYAASLSRLTAP